MASSTVIWTFFIYDHVYHDRAGRRRWRRFERLDPLIPLDDARHPRAAEWIDSGVLTFSSRAKRPLPESPVSTSAGIARGLVNAVREERRS